MITDVFGIVRRRKRAVLLTAASIFLLSAAVAFYLPKKYQSTTTILIEEREVPREYVPANITTFAEQRLQTINQRIVSTTRLLELIGTFNLYADLKDKMPVEEIVARMRQDIRFQTISADVIAPRAGRPAQATIAFSITYEGRNPETVRLVAGELASLYLRENLKTREKEPQETSILMEHGLEEEPPGERFSVIDEAGLPQKPFSPNVPAILLVGLVLGIGAGVGTAAVKESTDQTVRNPESLERATAFPVLGSIPVIVTEEDDARRRRRRRYVLAYAVLLFAVGILVFSMYVMDLDVLLAKVMRRFSL